MPQVFSTVSGASEEEQADYEKINIAGSRSNLAGTKDEIDQVGGDNPTNP